MAKVESISAERKELEQERVKLQFTIRQYKQYFLALLEQYEDLRQQKMDAGEEVPELPDWIYELAERAKQD